MVNITIGTPPQNLSLSLDIGSSDIWVNVPTSDYCAAKDDPCSSTGLFNIKDSSTFKQLDYKMNATYVSAFLAAGHYATDTLSIGGVKVKDMEFAVAEESQNPRTFISSYSPSSVNFGIRLWRAGANRGQRTDGILGIGYAANTDAATSQGHNYANLPEALVNSGAIKSPAYSLWLNKFDGTGNLLFGGVNKARYQGELQTVPVLPLYGKYYSLSIALTDISVKKSSGTKNFDTGLPLAVTLDNGSAFITLPQELIDPILKEIGAGYSKSDGVAYIDCTKPTPDYNVTFSFSGAKVTIPLSELVLDNYAEPGFPKGNCILGLAYSQPGVNLMGDSFMRGAYIVYDLANNEISLANTNYDGGDDDIHEIGTGTDAVPGATLMPSAVTSATGNGAVATGGASGAQPTTIYVTGTGTATGTGAATGTVKSGAATSTSKGLAVLPTSNPNHLLPGLLGAGLLLAL